MTAPLRPDPLTAESWDALFDFLDPARGEIRGRDRDAGAAARFLEITRKLACFFAARGCTAGDDLAAETMLRVARRCPVDVAATAGDRAAYVYGVARNVLHEWVRETRREATNLELAARDPTLVPLPGASRTTREVDEHRCLEECLGRLTPAARGLVLEYYAAEKSAKIARHRDLARQLGKSLNALRIEVHRIRNTLRRCVSGCLQQPVPGTPSS